LGIIIGTPVLVDLTVTGVFLFQVTEYSRRNKMEGKTWKALVIILAVLVVVIAGGLGYMWQSTSGKLSDTETDLAITEEKLASTESELVTTQDELSDTEDELETTQDMLDATMDELNDTENELSDVKDELSNIENELNDTKGELSITVANLASTESELASTAAQLISIQSKYPLRHFNSINSLRDWVDDHIVGHVYGAEAWVEAALEVQEMAMLDGYYVSVCILQNSNGTYTVWCGAKAGNCMYWWFPEVGDVMLDIYL
jgi:archaellum component FlaC